MYGVRKPPFLVFELFHLGHHGGSHAAKLGSPLAERDAADAQLPADLRHWDAGLSPLQCGRLELSVNLLFLMQKFFHRNF
jgi:hypothetical protein